MLTAPAQSRTRRSTVVCKPGMTNERSKREGCFILELRIEASQHLAA